MWYRWVTATYSGRCIFAGYRTDQPAFVEQDGELIYEGDEGENSFEIGIGNRMEVNVTGGEGGAEIDVIYDVLERFKK